MIRGLRSVAFAVQTIAVQVMFQKNRKPGAEYLRLLSIKLDIRASNSQG